MKPKRLLLSAHIITLVLLPAVCQAAWTTILQEDFENGFPSGYWMVYDMACPTVATWGLEDYLVHGGSNSIWCAGSRYDADYDYYPNDMSAWALYGPFSLADCNQADWSFWIANDIESGYDSIFYGVSIDGGQFYGSSLTGGTLQWEYRTVDFKSVYTLGDVTGQPQVWIGFHFESDFNLFPSYDGTFIDDILIRKNVVTPTPTAQPYTSTPTRTPTRTPTVTRTATPTPTPCSADDPFEPDDTMFQASAIGADSQPEEHFFCAHSDRDWLIFQTNAHYTYYIETSELGLVADTHVYLYAPNGITLLKENNNCQLGELRSCVEYTVDQAGNYFLMVRSHNGQWGQQADYNIQVWFITPTSTPSPTQSPTPTPTATITGTPTTSSTPTSTPSFTHTATPTPTQTPCAMDDPFEPDDTIFQANAISPNSEPEERFFCSYSDKDWLLFQAQVNSTYEVTTSELGPIADTELYLYATDRTTLIAQNNNCQFGVFESCVTIEATVAGTYYIMVSSHNGQWGHAADYNIQVAQYSPTFTPTSTPTLTPTNIPTAPAPMLDPLPSYIAGDKVKLSWFVPGPTSALHFYVERADDATFTLPDNSGWIPNTNFTFSSLTEGYHGHYRVKSRNLHGAMSYWSNVEDTINDLNSPVTSVLSLPSSTTRTMVDLNVAFRDAVSGVDAFEIYYNHDYHGWQRYYASFTASPVHFDATQTGGYGRYEFYSIGIDNAGNVETAPLHADAWIVIAPTLPPTATATVTPTKTPTGFPTASPTLTSTDSPQPTASPTATMTDTPIPTETPTSTATPDKEPLILLAGYWDSAISGNSGGSIEIVTLTRNAENVQIFAQGSPTGIFLPKVEPDMFWFGETHIGPGLKPTLTIVELIAGTRSRSSSPWPYLTVN